MASTRAGTTARAGAALPARWGVSRSFLSRRFAGDGRTLVYVGTVGGSIEGSAAGLQADGFVEAGVYRQAVVPRAESRVCLPLVLRVR